MSDRDYSRLIWMITAFVAVGFIVLVAISKAIEWAIGWAIG